MREALDWLASFFPKYGALLLACTAIFATAAFLLRHAEGRLADAVAGWCIRLAGVAFIAFVLAAIFAALRF